MVDVGSTEGFNLIIFYDDHIDANSFKAKLNGKDISSLFSPTPGEVETVEIKDKWQKKNKLRLSVLGMVEYKDRGNNQFK